MRAFIRPENDYHWLKLFLYCMVVSACVLTICSKSSFLYPLNDGNDVNCFFTVGKSIFNGKVLYRDIYEHKGLILYILYGMAYLISHTSFIAVYFIEVFCFSIFLYFSHSIVGLFVKNVPLLVLPILAAMICPTFSFSYGGQPEELFLPMLSMSLYIMLDYTRNVYPRSLSLRKVLLLGIFTGCILWSKYTMIGLYAGIIVLVSTLLLKDGEYRELFRYAGVYLAGFSLVTFPVIIYFMVNHALHDLFQVYFYNLLFLYSEPADLSWPILFLGNLIQSFRTNKYSLLIIAGILWMTFFSVKKISYVEKINIWMLCFFAAFGIFGGGVNHRYYILSLAIFSPLGFIPFILCFKKLVAYLGIGKRDLSLDRYIIVLLNVVVVVACLLFCYYKSYNIYLMKYKKSDMPQYIFRDIIAGKGNVNPRILNYGVLDMGLYTVCDVVPVCKYFCTCNIDLPELYEGQRKCISEGMVDYIISIRDIDLAVLNGKYRLVSKIKFEHEFDGAYNDYHLYELITKKFN